MTIAANSSPGGGGVTDDNAGVDDDDDDIEASSLLEDLLIVASSSEEDDSDDDEAFLPPPPATSEGGTPSTNLSSHRRSKSPTQSIRSVLSRPRSAPQRRATISGTSSPSHRTYMNVCEVSQFNVPFLIPFISHTCCICEHSGCICCMFLLDPIILPFLFIIPLF